MPLLGLALDHEVQEQYHVLDRVVDRMAKRIDDNEAGLSSFERMALQNQLDEHRNHLSNELGSISKRVARNSELHNDVSDLTARVDELKQAIARHEECTEWLSGIHVCRTPMYDKTIAPLDVTPKWMLHPEVDFCLKIETLSDVVPGTIPPGLGDTPDNYVCIEKSAAEKYADAFVPQHVQRYINDVGNTTLRHTDLSDMISCPAICHHRTCDEIARGPTIVHKSSVDSEKNRAVSAEAISFKVDDRDPRKICGACRANYAKCHPYDV